MNREIIDKAIDVLSELWDGKPKAWADFYNVVDYQTVKTALDALRAIPKPDPINGLVPCGCGGRPTFHHAYIARDDECYLECTGCGARSALRLGEERARHSWNTAMGWKE